MTEAHRVPVQAGNWRRDGWTLVPAFLSGDQLETLRSEADRLLARPDWFASRGEVVNSTRRSDRLDPVIDLSLPYSAAAHDPRLLVLAGELLGGEAQLFKDKFIAKPPGAPGYIAHQDGAYWPGMGLDTRRFLTAVLFLDDAGDDNGGIECVSGSHYRLLTPANEIADPDETELGTFTPIHASAGDLLLIHAFTPHRSGTNRSDRMRRALLFTYGVDDRPNLYQANQQHRAKLSDT